MCLIGNAWSIIVADWGVSGCKKKSANPFPASGAVAGWEKSSETRTFEPKDLWQYIDGDPSSSSRPASFPPRPPTTNTRDSSKPWSMSTPWADPMARKRSLNAGRPKMRRAIHLGDEGLQYAQSVRFRKGAHLVRIVAYQSNARNSASADGIGARSRSKPVIQARPRLAMHEGE